MVSPAREIISAVYGAMTKKIAKHPTVTAQTNQTPFERFKEATAKILSAGKVSVQKPTKRAKK